MSDCKAGAFRLIVREYPGDPIQERSFVCFDELCRAVAVYHRRPRLYSWPDEECAGDPVLEVFSPTGKPMDVCELAAHGERLRRGNRYVPGDGPVPGTGRLGGYRYFRRPRTAGEARLAQAFDDEVPARPARRAPALRDARDDVGRCIQRSWKEQGRARKGWDRPPRRARV